MNRARRPPLQHPLAVVFDRAVDSFSVALSPETTRQHRGTARNRVVPVVYDAFAPEAGTPVVAGERPVGTMGSSAQGRGLAMLRLDRVEDALAAGAALSAGGVALRLVKPDWARFPWPGEPKAG